MIVAPAALFGLPEWAGRLSLAGLIVAGALVLLAFVTWFMGRLIRRTTPAQGPRARQRETAVTALASALRYLILIGALIALFFTLAGGGALAAVSSGALIVAIVGFASRQLLEDAIAGFFILFEDEYAVGDLVRLEPSGYTGRVQSIGLRSTVLTGADSGRMVIPNGDITGIRVYRDGRLRVRLEMLTREPDALRAAVHEIAGSVAGAGGPWDGPPRVVARKAEGELTRLIAILEVDPTREGAAETWLAEALAAHAGDLLVGPPLAIAEGSG